MIKRLDKYRRNVIVPFLALIIFVGLWELVVHVFNISRLVLPTPSDIAQAAITHGADLLKQSGITLVRSVLGFLAGMFAAIILALTFQLSRIAELAIYPYAIALRAVPIVAIAPLTAIWFPDTSEVVLAATITFFPILVNTVQGLRSVDPLALDLFATYGASPWQMLIKLRLFCALPMFAAGCKTSSAFAVVGVIVAELVSSNNGIGAIIKSSSYYLETDLTFAAIICAGLLGLTFFGVVAIGESLLKYWTEPRTTPMTDIRQTQDEMRVVRASSLIDRHLQHKDVYRINFHGLDIDVFPGVFCPAYGEGSKMLAELLPERLKGKVLDMGTGTGVLALLAAHAGAEVVAVDTVADAVRCAKANAVRLGLQNQIDIRQGNVFEPIEQYEKFSLVLFNPPFMNGRPHTNLEKAIYDENYDTLNRFPRRITAAFRANRPSTTRFLYSR